MMELKLCEAIGTLQAQVTILRIKADIYDKSGHIGLRHIADRTSVTIDLLREFQRRLHETTKGTVDA